MDKENIEVKPNEKDIEKCEKLFSRLVGTVARGAEDEEVLKLYGKALVRYNAFAESAYDMAKEILNSSEQYAIEPTDFVDRTPSALSFIKDYWDGHFEDIFTAPDHSAEIAFAEEYISNKERLLGLNGPQNEFDLQTDQDFLNQASEMKLDGSVKIRTVTSANFFNADGSPDPEGAFSEKIFGPEDGASCSCGVTSSATGAHTGAFCPDCGEAVHSAKDRKELWAVATSPVPLTYGREAFIAAALNLSKEAVELMAAGGTQYPWYEPRRDEEGRPIGDGFNQNESVPDAKPIYGAEALENALKLLDEKGPVIAKHGDFVAHPALVNAYEALYKAKQEHMYYTENTQPGTKMERDLKDSEETLYYAELAYKTIYHHIKERQNSCQSLMVHYIPIPPPGVRPINDLNGKSSLGPVNEELQTLLENLKLGEKWLGSFYSEDYQSRLYDSVNDYIEVNAGRIVGKTGIYRGRLLSVKTKDVIGAVITPRSQGQEGMEYFKYIGINDMNPRYTVGLPRAGLRNMYLDEIRRVLSKSGMDKDEIKKELKVPAGTKYKDENGNETRCKADLALDAVLTGKGYVEESNPFGLSRMRAREVYREKIEAYLKKNGFSKEEIEIEFNVPADSFIKDSEGNYIRCAVDQVLDILNPPSQFGTLTALSRNPVIETSGIQFFYAYPVDDATIHMPPLVMEGFKGDFDGDTMTAVKLMQGPAHKEARRLLNGAIQADVSGNLLISPKLESLIALHRASRNLSGNEFSFKYRALIEKLDPLKESLIDNRGATKCAMNITAYRIAEELDGCTLSYKAGDVIPPGVEYGKKADGTPLIGKTSITIREQKGKLYAVDSYPDSIRIPRGAHLTDKKILEKGESLAEARVFTGTKDHIARKLEEGALVPVQKVKVREADGTLRETTAGKAAIERFLPPGTILGDQEINAKYINNLFVDYIHSFPDLTEGREKADRLLTQLSDYGFEKCGLINGTNMSVFDFAQAETIEIGKIYQGRSDSDFINQYLQEQKRIGEGTIEYRKDFNNAYDIATVQSGVKGKNIITNMLNNPVVTKYNGEYFVVSEGSYTNGNFGFAKVTKDTDAIKGNNKTGGVADTGAARNKVDNLLTGSFLEEGDCGTTEFVSHPLTEENVAHVSEELEGRTLATDLVRSDGTKILERGEELTKEAINEAFKAGIKKIDYRSALTCKCKGVCEKCAGHTKNVETKVGADLRTNVTSAWFGGITQSNLDVAKRANKTSGLSTEGNTLEAARNVLSGRIILNSDENKAFRVKLGITKNTALNKAILLTERMKFTKLPLLYRELFAKRAIRGYLNAYDVKSRSLQELITFGEKGEGSFCAAQGGWDNPNAAIDRYGVSTKEGSNALIPTNPLAVTGILSLVANGTEEIKFEQTTQEKLRRTQKLLATR